MPVKYQWAADQYDRLVKQLQDEAEQEAVKLQKLLTAFVDQQFGRTFKFWGDSGVNKFERPLTKYTIAINKNKSGVKMVVRVVVVDGSGQPHVLWHYLTFGTRDWRATKTIRFRVRNQNRTTPNTLDVAPFAGFGSWVTLKAGRVRKGIVARRWYEAVLDEVEKWAASQKEFDGWKVIGRLDR
jgi:hypothetical protein